MFLRVVTSVFTGALASVAFGAVCPDVTAEPTEGGSAIRIRHKEVQPLTAFLVEIADYPGNHFAYMEDLLFRGKLAAGEVRRVVVQNLMPGTVPEYLKVTAAIFEDGATCGSAGKLKVLLDGRRADLQFTRELIGRVETALSAGVSIATLATDLAEWARSFSSGSRVLVSNVIDELKMRSADRVLASLRAVEKTLLSSKPAL